MLVVGKKLSETVGSMTSALLFHLPKCCSAQTVALKQSKDAHNVVQQMEDLSRDVMIVV